MRIRRVWGLAPLRARSQRQRDEECGKPSVPVHRFLRAGRSIPLAFGIVAFGLEFVDDRPAAGALCGSGGNVINVPSPAGPVIFQYCSVTSGLAPMNCALRPCSRFKDRYCATNTVKAQGKLFVNKGTVLYSDLGKVLFTVIKDTCGRHDTIYGCCSEPNNFLLLRRPWHT